MGNRGLEDAMKEYEQEDGGDDAQKEEEGSGEGHAAMMHVNHGKKHSSHKISHEGKAESEMHDAGEKPGDCPMCG